MRHPIRQKDVVQLWTGDARALVTASHRVPSWRRGAESVLVIWFEESDHESGGCAGGE